MSQDRKYKTLSNNLPTRTQMPIIWWRSAGQNRQMPLRTKIEDLKKKKSKLFTATHSTKADVDLDTDYNLFWHWATVFYAILILEAFQKVVDYPTAGLPDHALVEDQSEDVTTDVKFSVWRLEETQTNIHWISISWGEYSKASGVCFCIGMANSQLFSYSNNSGIINITNN